MRFLLLINLALILASSCNTKGTSQPREPVERVDETTIRVHKEALENLKIKKAQTAPFPELLSLMGKIGVTEDRTTIIPSRVAGRIESILFASGETVLQGQILATLFSPDFVSAKEEYQQALKQIKPGTGHGDPSDFENLAKLSRKKLETIGLSHADIEALSQAESSDLAKSLLSIRAPRSGVLIQKTAVLGNLVNVGDTLFIIGDLSKVWFSGDIYTEDLPKVHKGQSVFINAAGMEKPLFGKVSFISPLVDPSTRSIKIRALMDNPKNALKADQYVQGNVVLINRDSLLIPTEAIVRTPDGTVVYKRTTGHPIEGSEGSLDFKRVPVTVGSEQQGMTAITSGLQEWDEVVSEGALLLNAALNSAGNK